MKEYCVDLEIAKELKENGFTQDTGFYFYRQDDGDIDIKGNLTNRKEWGLSFISYKTDKEWLLADFGHPDKWMGIQPEHFVSAPIAEELIKELPREIKDLNFEYYYHLKIEQSPIHDERFLVSYGITTQDRAWMEQHHTEDKKLSNALALMWKLLKKEGYIHKVQRQ